ncbi:chromosome partitioning protein ParA [Laspinema olomoucense]|uniref:chromosome partitioning protein ParA n=1 Tax=Laspinema olomoucense TaxID=3231600 RepID=UPI0021BB5748|nr:chromosome partitioning protein ParA [Laspinema sp. D3a]MCT7989012.1 chromosome partitioning protein ParA [Laspinema sp. D3a]
MKKQNIPSSTVLIIASMHRSGSSLTASLLQSAGLHIGRRLMPPNKGNLTGYFENNDFYEFHRRVLKSQGIDEDGWTLQENIEVEDRFVEQAKEIIANNSICAVWGWKEPRTTLFLKFWVELLPQAKFLLIYRSPWEVVDSMYRRTDYELFQSQPDLAVKIWLHYNQKILNFYNNFSQGCLLANLETIVKNTAFYIQAINQNFQVNLGLPAGDIYDASLLHTQSVDSHRASLINHYFPEAIALYRELMARAWQPDETVDFSWLEQLKSSPYKVWAFQDWVTVGNLATQKKNLESELQQNQSQLQQQTEQLHQSQSQLYQTQEESEQTQFQLHQIQAELGQAQSQLQQTEEVLEQSQAQLHETEEVLEQSVTQLSQRTEELERSQSQLYQTQEELGQTQFQFHSCQQKLAQTQSQLYQTQEELGQTHSQLHQTEEVLEQSQSQLHKTKTVLEQFVTQLTHKTEELRQSQSQLYQTQEESKQIQSQLHQIQAELGQAQSQLQQTEEVLEQSQAQLHETEEVLEQSVTQLSQRTEELERSQSQLYQTQEELGQTHSQLHQTEEVLEQSQSQLHKTKTVLEQFVTQLTHKTEELRQSQSQLYQTQEESEQTQFQLHQIQAELEQAQSQLHSYQEQLGQTQSRLDRQTEELAQWKFQQYQTQQQLERLHFQEIIARETEDPAQRQYKLLLWDAWYAYINDDKQQMQKCLEQSWKFTPFLRTETIFNWLQTFAQLSATTRGWELDTYSLTNSAEWQQLINRKRQLNLSLKIQGNRH